MLSRLDLQVLTAHDPNHALRLVDANSVVDLVVTDIRLPDINGVELMRRIRQRLPKMKVIYVSGDPDAEEMISDADRGCRFLQKPFGLRELEETVRPLLTG